MTRGQLSREILSEIIIFNKYSKYNKSLKRRETWREIVDRNRGMHLEKFPNLKKEIIEAYKFVYDKKVLPSMRSLQFGGDPIKRSPSRIFNCLGGETEIITSYGVFRIDSFKNNEKIRVLTPSGSWKKAIVKTYGKQKLYKIEFANGRTKKTIRATKDHRWLLFDGEFTSNLKVGDKLKRPPDIFSDFDYDSAPALERLYWCYGMVYGDGTILKNKKGEYKSSIIRLCGHDNKYVYRFEEMGFSTSKPLSCKGDIMVCTGKYLKTTPDPKVDSPELVRAFCRGYMDADGFKVNDKTMTNFFKGIQASGQKSNSFIEKCFGVAGLYITNKIDNSDQITNFGKRKFPTFSYGIKHNLSGRDRYNRYSVQSIVEDTEEEVWCLEVEDEHSFVLSCGITTGNCSYLPMNHPEAFNELMFLLLSGCGVGYSVQKHHIKQLPNITVPHKTRRFLVGDSIEGWSDAVQVLIKAYLGNRVSRPEFDFSDIRPKGADLITSGGKAPGPEPLKTCLHNIQTILDRKKTGDKLTPLEVHDICCFVADGVLSGGIRRSAMIALFSYKDEEMLSCKFGDWWDLNPQRARANNSVVFLRHKIQEKDFFSLWEKIKNGKTGEPGIFFTNDKECLTNPCAEISLRENQFCNLTTINVSDVENQEDFNNRARAASFIGTLQASYTNFHYLREEWKVNTEKEALLGVSMTGIASGKVLDLDMKEAAKIVVKENERVSSIIGINPASRCTTVKPEGTSSLVLGCSSGIHAWHNDFYIRRIRIGKNEALYEYLLKNNSSLIEDDYFKPHNQAIISLPIKAPDKATLRSETALQFLSRVKRVYKDWILSGHKTGDNTHNVSATISIKDNEWDRIGKWMWENKSFYNALSVLPYSDHSYIQAPFEDIDEQTYKKMLNKIKEIDLTKVIENKDETAQVDNLACSGDNCEVV